MCYRLETLVHDCGNFFTKSEKRVLLSLANRADPKDWICWPSVADTAFRTVFSKRQIHRIQRKLHEIGIIAIIRNTGRPTNHYQLNSPRGFKVLDNYYSNAPITRLSLAHVFGKKYFANSPHRASLRSGIWHFHKIDIRK